MQTEYINSYSQDVIQQYEGKRWWLNMTIADVLDKNADLYSTKEALVAQNNRYTYAQLRSLADKFAYGLLSNGFKQCDRVMLQLPNWPEFIVAHYGIQKAGLVMVLLTVNHTAREIAHLASLTEPKGWILPARYRDKDYLPLIEIVTEKIPNLDRIIMADVKSSPGYLNFNDLLVCDADSDTITRTITQARPKATDVCYLLPTGGTTNLPKCAVRTHNDYLCNIEYKSRAWDINTTDISLVGTTVGHNLALLVGISGPFFHGAKVVLVDSTRPQDFCQAVQDEKVTCASLVPTIISRIVAYENLTNYDLSSLTKIYVGAANSPPDLVTRVEERIGCRYINAFGMVEGPCSQTRLSDPLEVRCETIGLPVCPYDDFQTLDADGNKTSAGVEGEMAARGPGVFSGYYRNAQTNQFAFTPDGYFRTGDLAIIDENKRIRITGRIKDIIIRGGENISARDVEDIISSHPNVEYVAAVGMPDEDLGEQVCAFVKPIDGAEISHEDVVAHMKRLDAAKALVPVCTEIIEEIPLTAAGKADKKVLKKVIAKKLRQTMGDK